MFEPGPLLERFRGADGKSRLADVFGDQELVLHSKELAQRFAGAAEVKLLENGENLYIQGQAGSNFAYFLISGQLNVLVHGVNQTTLVPGQMIGEFPIVNRDLAHAVTICAREYAIVALVSEREFLSIAEEHPKVWMNMAKMLVRRLHDCNNRHVSPVKSPCVFIGHGRNALWKEIDTYIAKKLHVKTLTYEAGGHAGESTERILRRMLAEASFAVLVMTAEDQTAAGGKRARQNVIHEAGLFQGVLGFDRAVMLVQSGVEAFSNIAGLRFIEFEGESIGSTFAELTRTLENKGLVAKGSEANRR